MAPIFGAVQLVVLRVAAFRLGRSFMYIRILKKATIVKYSFRDFSGSAIIYTWIMSGVVLPFFGRTLLVIKNTLFVNIFTVLVDFLIITRCVN